MTAARGTLRAWCWRWSAALVVALAATAVTVYPPYANWPPIRSDGSGYHIWTYALLKGDLSFAWFQGDRTEVALHQPDPAVTRYTCKYPPGVAILRLPVMAWAADPARNGPPFSPAEHWACLALGALTLVATAALCLDACYRLGASPLWANLSILVLTFGTGLFHYGTYDGGYSHVYSAALAAGLMWLTVRAISLQHPLPVWPIVAFVALLLLVRTTNVVLIGSWACACAVWGSAASRSPGFRHRSAGAATVGVFLGVVATLGVNYEMFGRLTFHTYPGEEFHWNEPHLLAVLFGEDQGLLTSYPVLGLSVVITLLAGRTRRAALGFLLVLAGYTVLYGHWWTWHLGCGFGHRGFVEAVPFAIPILSLALTVLPRKIAIGFGGVALIAAGFTLVQMCTYWGSRLERTATF